MLINYSHYISSDNSIPFTSSFPKVTIPGSVSEDAEYNIAIDGGNASSSFLLAAGNVVYSGTLPSQGADNISLTQASPLSTYESIINYDVYIYQDKYGISAALLPVPLQFWPLRALSRSTFALSPRLCPSIPLGLGHEKRVPTRGLEIP